MLCSLVALQAIVKNTYNNNFRPLPVEYCPKEKAVTVILYMAADNDLRTFAYKNLQEIKYMIKATPATEYFNIFIHLDVHNPGQNKMTFHLVAHNKELCVAWQGQMDSGKEETLVFAYTQAMRYCPGKKVVLGLWDHGTGDLNPTAYKHFNPADLFEYDAESKRLVLNRTLGFIDYIEHFCASDDKGICFDDTHHTYLKNQSVGRALQEICTTLRNGEKIDLLFCDSCLMSGIGFAQEIKSWVKYLIASEEVILATGFRYDQVLNFFNQDAIDLEKFIQHTVKSFGNTYERLTPDYTLSGINLQNIDPLYQKISDISALLIEALKDQYNKKVKEYLKNSSRAENCTTFDETTYKDLKHLLTNFLKNLNTLSMNDSKREQTLKKELQAALKEALAHLSQVVIAHCAGKNLDQSGGISIYVPHSRIHSSFQHTTFAQQNLWSSLIMHYLAA